MSLLMEALRKAEAAKRAGQSTPASETGTEAAAPPSTRDNPEVQQATPEVFTFTTSQELLALAPREEDVVETKSPVTPTPAVLPTARITDNDDVLDDYLTAAREPELDELTPRVSARERVKVQEQRGRNAAASMFDAKDPQTSNSAKRRQRVQILSLALAFAVIAVGGAWWYLYKMPGNTGIGVNRTIANYNLEKRGFLGEQPATAPAATVQNAVPATTAAQAPATVPNPASSPVAAVKNDNVALAVSEPVVKGTSQVDSAQNPDAAAAAPIVPTVPTVSTGNQAAGTAAAAGTTLEISKSSASAKVQPGLLAAYNQLQKGNLAAANDLYQELVSRYPNNRDALLGLASVHMQLGDQQAARTTYTHLLKLNPQDALARTGMLQTISATDPASYEKALLSLRQQFPTLAPLSFALGNYYATDGRWHEAQSAYFDALSQARQDTPDNISPDYAFNLAVSLEQLGQKRAALEYYKQAESLALTIKPGFDPMMLRQRLSALEQQR